MKNEQKSKWRRRNWNFQIWFFCIKKKEKLREKNTKGIIKRIGWIKFLRPNEWHFEFQLEIDQKAHDGHIKVVIINNTKAQKKVRENYP